MLWLVRRAHAPSRTVLGKTKRLVNPAVVHSSGHCSLQGPLHVAPPFLPFLVKLHTSQS
jgi:hypothetical protein